MTPTKTFKFSKRNKTMMALLPFKDKATRNAFKRMMIDAQLCSEIVIKVEKRDKNAPRGGTATYVTNDTGTASTQV